MIQQVYPTVNHPYTFELNKDFNFSAAHFIPSEDAGKCMRTHGHTYFVNLTIVGDTLDHNGFLINFSELKRLVHDQFDHYLLNDLPQFKDKSPSTEIVAQTILKSYKLILTSMTINLNVYKCIYVKHHQVMLSIVQRRINNAFKNTSFRNFGPTIQGEGRVIGRKQCLSAQRDAIIVVVGAIPPLRGMVALKMI